MISAPTAAQGERCDVLVIGGGPAGATIAALLAAQGRDVLMLEKAHHPRFHIGESLLPANVALFERLGVRDAVERIGMRKWGVEFVSPDHAHQSLLEFGDAWDKTMPYAWQVRRSELDELLFRHAQQRGARTQEGCRVREVRFDDEGATVEARLDDGARRSVRARFVVDASGRDTFLANKLRSKQKNPKHNSAALFGHFTGAQRLPGRLEGNISIFWFAHGWFWLIPLALLPEVARQAAGGFFCRHHHAVPAARRAPGERDLGGRHRACHRQLLLRRHALQRRALPDARRRLHLRRPGVLLGRLPGDAECL